MADLIETPYRLRVVTHSDTGERGAAFITDMDDGPRALWIEQLRRDIDYEILIRPVES